MSTRFHLRFESGDRQGDLVPVPRSGLLVGRRPGNDLRLDAASVSGRHALLRPDDDRLRVEDMGSTNGTRVDGEKIETVLVAHGQRVVFGDVAFEVVDGEAEPSLASTASTPTPALTPTPPAEDGGFALEDEIELGSTGAPALPTSEPMPKAAPAAQPVDASALDPSLFGEGLQDVDDASLDRTRGSRVPSLVIIALLLLGLGGAAWAFLSGDGGAGESPVVSILEREGQMLVGTAMAHRQDHGVGGGDRVAEPSGHRAGGLRAVV
ncbi:MAG: FHA domain-containing protein [Planctomycetota bacterium]